ncbi:hypothetical protein TSUD_254840 [Trifolium subterraneum]|uniref:F-box associated beta-propeller type 1 domain-containing protein n=1 Tax=Trifolium subterraneum TaxID=3900 RepID=A0A2Z6NHT3_TRISU|nr:hypothetical protein TSUD_254840 [Trifolium subterraneum]
MERSVEVVVGTNEELKKEEVSSIHVPDDIAFSILSKLSIKSLKRFGCVRKSWSRLFENPYFMSMLRNHFLSNNNNHSDYGGGHTFLVIQEYELPLTYLSDVHCIIYLLSNDDDKFDNRIKLDLPPPFHDNDSLFYILSSVSINGILCVGQDTTRESVEIFQAVLWNPATAEYMVIPLSPSESVPPYRDTVCKFHGFGYDHVTDDYKLIRYLSFFRGTDTDYYEYEPWEDIWYDPLLEIYSLRSNSWKLLEIDMHDIAECVYYASPRLGREVYMDGLCHWWGSYDLQNVTGCLVSFDFSNEVLFTTPMLLELGECCDDIIDRRLVVLNESIALISNCFQASTFHISILSELGVKESWFKLFIVGPISFIECPIGVGKKGDICFKQKNDELVWIDLSTQIIDEIGVKGDKYCFQMGIYNESLLQIRGFNN